MIIFLYGEDTFRSRQKLKEIKDKFLREVDPSGNSLTVLDGERITMEKINESISPASLLSRKRLTVIENLFSNKNQQIFSQFYEYLKKRKAASDNIIVIWDSVGSGEKLAKAKSDLFKNLRQQKFSGEFKPLSNTEATAWAKNAVQARGGKIAHQAAATLASFLGSDLWQINNEINKLIHYKLGQKLDLPKGAQTAIIEVEDVEMMVKGQFDESIFALTDAISSRNKGRAAKLFAGQIEAGYTDDYLLNMIIRQFRILLQIRQGLDSGLTSRKIVNLLKLHPFVVQKGIGQARNFSSLFLRGVLNRLVEIDYMMKTGRAGAKAQLSLLIAKI